MYLINKLYSLSALFVCLKQMGMFCFGLKFQTVKRKRLKYPIRVCLIRSYNENKHAYKGQKLLHLIKNNNCCKETKP